MRMLRWVLCVFAVHTGFAAGGATPVYAQAAVRSALSRQLEAAVLAQRRAWQQEELSVHGELPLNQGQQREPAMRRVANALCWPRGYVNVNFGTGWIYPVRTLMQGDVAPGRTVCPDWIPREASGEAGHARGAPPSEPAGLVPFPSALLDAFDQAAARAPSDAWIARQRIRMLVENGDTARADSLALACAASHGWCGMLQGYTATLRGRAIEAIRRFDAALAAWPDTTRCEWEMIPAFMPLMRQSTDPAAWCARNAERARAIWWLATPFYADSVDWRRLEHLTRRVRHALVTDLPLDVYYDLRGSKGSEVILDMRLRYGWASHMLYPGSRGEDLYRFYSNIVAPPFSAPEFTMQRVATLPTLRAGLSPFSVRDTDFQLTAPDTVSPYVWWPVEHFQHPGGLLDTLQHQQRVLLRRDSTVLLVVASDLRDGLLSRIGDAPVHSTLVFTPTPDSIAMLAQQRSTRGATVVMHGELASEGIAGLEHLVQDKGVAGSRTRFGIDSLPTLTSLPYGGCAISEPMLVRPDALTGAGTADAMRGLLGSLTLTRPDQLGLLWEGYGFASTDSTRVSVQIASVTNMSRLRRAGVALGLADDPTTSVSMQWDEPRAPVARTALSTRMPSTSRQLRIAIGKLRAGDYLVAIAMERKGCAAVRSERAFRIIR